MPQLPNSPIRNQFFLRGWSAIAAVLLVLGAIVLLAVGLLVFFLPVLLVAPILYWLLPKPKTMPHAMNNDIPGRANDADIIEGDFTVVSATAIDQQSEPPGKNRS